MWKSITEAFFASQDKRRHNANDGGNPDEKDKRSDDKGPELEALAVTEINGVMLAAVAAERQGGIALLDISDPANVNLLFDFYINGQPNDLISPETMQFIDVNEENVLWLVSKVIREFRVGLGFILFSFSSVIVLRLRILLYSKI